MRTAGALSFALLLALAVACQPTGGPPGTAPTETATGDGGSPLGAPAVGLPRTLEELTGRGLRIAEEWQDEPVLVEIEVDLDEQRRWREARLVYLAADADRFLALTAVGGSFNQQQPTLSTLQVLPVTAAGVEQIPALPDDAAPPAELAAAPEVTECEVAAAATVLYTTGAPVAWDGAAWTSPPEWRATVTGTEGAGGAVFPDVSGGTASCLS